jgi:hypothetical protein
MPTVGSPKPPPWERRDQSDEYRGLCRSRVTERVEVREPFVLVAQIQRSGGSLMNALFDGHPECHVLPGDLELGYPRRSIWPRIELQDGPDRWFEILYQDKNHKQLQRMLREVPLHRPGTFPRCFLPRLQKEIFDACVAERPIERARDVIDCYLTSYFNAWLDNHNLYPGPKRVVVAFGPKMHIDAGGLGRFFDAYPDGTLISIVRDPRAWFASARTHKPIYAHLEPALDMWERSAEATIAAKERFGDRVIVLSFEDVILETEGTITAVAERLGVTMSAALLEPSFNGRPKNANSSHRVERAGILTDRTQIYREVLDASTIARIEARSGDLHDRARALALH